MHEVLGWGFVTCFSLILLAAFGLALSRLGDAGIIGLGVASLFACLVAVTCQGLHLGSLLDERDAKDLSETGSRLSCQGDSDTFVVRAYTLALRPDKMQSLGATFSASSLAVPLTERGYVQCAGVVALADVSYAADATFLVVSRGPTSDVLRADVLSGRVSSILLGSALLRIIALTAQDFNGDTNGVAKQIAASNDIYIVAARGSSGSVPVNTSTGCTTVNIYMPWSTETNQSQTNKSAHNVITPLLASVHSGSSLPVQVWGIGSR